MVRAGQRVLFCLLAALCLPSGMLCKAAEAVPQTSAQAYILMEAGSGRVLAGKNTGQEMAIASTTKIMTALVALEHGNLSDQVVVKENHLKEGSSMYLRAGEVLTLEALLYGLLLPSGNDAAECIAEHCGGSREQFVAWMNETAQRLGMTHTSFANPSGLDAEGHYSCAEDMAHLAAAAMDEPTFVRIASTKTAAVGERMLGNHNKLLLTLSGCTGGKTGYTDAAGRTLVTCCERDGMRLIAVTLNDREDWKDHAALYEYGFRAYAQERVVSDGEICAVLPVRGGTQAEAALAAGVGFAYPVAEGENLTVSMRLPEALTAPVEAGERVGTLAVLLDGHEVAQLPVINAERIGKEEKRGWMERFSALFSGERGR